MAGNNKAPDNSGFDFPEELMSGEYDIDKMFADIKDPKISPEESFEIANDVFGILKRKSERLTRTNGLSDLQREKEQRELDEKMAEVQRILAQGHTRRTPRPTDDTVRVIAPNQDTKISSVESTIVDRDADDDEKTLVFQRKALEEVLSQEEPTKNFSSPAPTTDSTQTLIYKISTKDPEKPKNTSFPEVLAIASGDVTADSTVALLSRHMVKGMGHDETSPISDVNDVFESEPTHVEDRFSRTSNVISTLFFLEYDNYENTFRGFLNNCQERPRGKEELILIFENLEENFKNASAEKKDVFLKLLNKVIEKPGEDEWKAKMAMKGSDLGKWKNGICEVLIDLKERLDNSQKINIFAIPTMNFSHAMEEIVDCKNFQERLKEVLVYFYKSSPRKIFFKELTTEILKLEKSSKYEVKDFIIDTLSELDFEFTVRLEMEINRIKVEENKKIIVFPSKTTEEKKAITQEVAYKNENNEDINEEKKKRGVLMAFLNKYRGRLAMAGSAIALLGVVGVSVFGSKNENAQEGEESATNNANTQEIIKGGALGGVSGMSGMPTEQVVSFDNADKLVVAAAKGATDGIASAEKAKADDLISGIALAKDNVSKAGEMARETAIDASLASTEIEKPVWNYTVKEGDTFFKVAEDWKSYYGFSEARDKYKFLQKIDNWDLITAMRLIFNKENGRNRDLDIYKGSDKDIADTFSATPYQMFMEIYKFKSRSQRNFVIKYMENGGDFNLILEAIDRGYFIAENGDKIPLSVEIKKKFEQKKVSMMKRYHKRRGSVKDIKATEVIIDETFKFASQGARNFVLDRLNAGETIENVMSWMKKGWAIDDTTGKAISIIAEVRKSPERKTYKLDTGFSVIKGKKAIEQYLAGVEEAKRQKEIKDNLSDSEQTWDDIALEVEIQNGLLESEKVWDEIEKEIEVQNNLTASEEAWKSLLAEKEMEEAWEQILDEVQISERSPDEIALGTKSDIYGTINA